MTIDLPPKRPMIKGLYVITPEPDGAPHYAPWLSKIASALSGGVKTLQLRAKNIPKAELNDLARDVIALCKAHQTRCIMNDSLDLAQRVGAHGVHLGREDGAIATARKRAPDLILGASCYTDFAAALKAVADGADYVAFGSVFSSLTKPDAQRASFEHFEQLFVEAKARGMNSVAIGGIDLDNVARVVAAGADAVAMISAIFDAPEPAVAVTELNRRFGAV